MRHSAPRLQLRFALQLRKINCTSQKALVEKAAWWAAMWHAGYSTHSNFAISLPLRNFVRTPLTAFRCIPRRKLLRLPQLRFASAAPQNQLHLAECTCRKSGGLRCDMRFLLLKVRLRCKACHAEERAAFRSTPPTPRSTTLPPLRKINCTLQNALATKFAWWAAMCFF